VVPHPAAAVVWRVLGNGEEIGSRGFLFQLGKKCIKFFFLYVPTFSFALVSQIDVNRTGNHVAVQISFVLFWSVRAAVDQFGFGRFRDRI
jgi:hypothetical protein